MWEHVGTVRAGHSEELKEVLCGKQNAGERVKDEAKKVSRDIIITGLSREF